jgi:rfaE bifunctional protein nucleotidyltransferase chain/domain
VSKIVNIEDLKKALAPYRGNGKRVVFTNGCFDILHVGHIRYLREARALGDVLVVGLNSDISVARLKPGRPVNNESNRSEVLAALEMVDFIVIFSEDTPYELIKAVKPDILVKGGDWKKEDIVGSDIVPEVHSLPFTEGASTTAIIDRIRALK